MKLLTRLLIGTLVLVLLVVGAGGVLLGFVIDPNDYRTEIEQSALDNAGVELKINGEIGWSVFPWLGLAVNDIDVRYPDKPDLAQLEQAQLSVKLLPLISGGVEMSSVQVNGLKLNLITTGKSNNWTPATEGNAEQQPAEADSPATSDVGSRPIGPFAIEEIVLSDAQIRYVDEPAGSRLEISNLNLTTGMLIPKTPIPVELSADIRQFANNEESLSVSTNLSGDALLDLETQRYQLNGIVANTRIVSLALGGEPLELDIEANLDADVDKQVANLGIQKLAIAQINAKGQVSIEEFTNPTIKGELRVDDFNLKQLLESLGQTAPVTSDPKALTRVGMSATLGGPANTLTLDPLALHIDDTSFDGKASVDLKTMAQTLNLKGDSFNADRYMPPGSDSATSGSAEGGTTSGGQKGWSKEEIIPVEPLKALNLDATFDLGQLTVSGINARNVGLTLNAHDGLVKLSRINADLYSGQVRNSATLDARKSPLQIAINKKVSGIQLGELLTDLSGEAPITGSFNSTANLTAQGQSMHAIINSLNGQLNVQASDGVIEGISMAQTICQGINNVASLGINSEQVDQSTPFADMGGNFTITNGVVSNNDLTANLDAMAMTGRGSVDLPQTLIDYRLGMTIKENLFKQTCSVNNRLQGVEFPVNCKGAFDTPPAKMCRPDASAFTNLLKAEAKKKVEEKIGSKIEEKLGEKLGDEGAKSLLKGLFGN